MTESLKGGSVLLKRALDLEEKKRYSEALVCYQEGLKIYIDYIRVAPTSEKKSIRDKIDQLMSRAETVKNKVDEQEKLSAHPEEIQIVENSTGHSYESVFGRFLDSDVTVIKVEDPYIRINHQLNNFLRLCELCVKKCTKLNKIMLVTCSAENHQQNFLASLRSALQNHGVSLEIQWSTTLHDRQISLNNGWLIKMGRGLDYFKAPSSNISLGYFDLDLRLCHETNITIFFVKDLIIS